MRDEIISKSLHSYRVYVRNNKLEKESESRNRKKIIQRRELARKKQKQDGIAARLRSEGIDARWIGEAMLIMEEYGYGPAQVRRKVVPILKSRIEQLLIEESRQNEATSHLSQAIALRVAALKDMTRGIDTDDDHYG